MGFADRAADWWGRNVDSDYGSELALERKKRQLELDALNENEAIRSGTINLLSGYRSSDATPEQRTGNLLSAVQDRASRTSPMEYPGGKIRPTLSTSVGKQLMNTAPRTTYVNTKYIILHFRHEYSTHVLSAHTTTRSLSGNGERKRVSCLVVPFAEDWKT